MDIACYSHCLFYSCCVYGSQPWAPFTVGAITLVALWLWDLGVSAFHSGALHPGTWGNLWAISGSGFGFGVWDFGMCSMLGLLGVSKDRILYTDAAKCLEPDLAARGSAARKNPASHRQCL